MNFPLNAYLLAIVGSVMTAVAALPFWRKWCMRAGFADDPGERKIHHSTIPLAGGLAVFTGILVPLLAGIGVVHWNLLGGTSTQALAYGLSKRSLQIAGIFAGAFGILLLGLADDKWELKPGLKFAGQLGVALLVAACGVRVTLFVPSAVFSYFITAFWILTVINAFNFMDNMNGLCAGLGVIAAWQFALVSAIAGQYLVALLCFLIAGALLGFLPYNFPKATSFLGDSGSHLVGYLLAILAILPHFYTPLEPKIWTVTKPLLVLAVPLADLVSVVLLRWKLGKPFYIGDNNHLSHRLVRSGCSPSLAVALIWLLAAIIGSVAVLW